MKSIKDRLFVFIFACVSALVLSQPAFLSAKEIEVHQEDEGKTVTLDIGDKLYLCLIGNPSTGFTWTVASPAVPSLKFLGCTYRKTQHSPGVVGAPGLFCFGFQAVAKGKAELKLIYARPWENTPPAQTFSMNVNVK